MQFTPSEAKNFASDDVKSIQGICRKRIRTFQNQVQRAWLPDVRAHDRVTRDEVLHVEMAAKSSALEYNFSSIAVNETCTAISQNRVDSFGWIVRDLVVRTISQRSRRALNSCVTVQGD